MKVGGKLHSLAAFTPEKFSLAHFEQEAVRAPEQVLAVERIEF
jgi:hypothetical protein